MNTAKAANIGQGLNLTLSNHCADALLQKAPAAYQNITGLTAWLLENDDKDPDFNHAWDHVFGISSDDY